MGYVHKIKKRGYAAHQSAGTWGENCRKVEAMTCQAVQNPGIEANTVKVKWPEIEKLSIPSIPGLMVNEKIQDRYFYRCTRPVASPSLSFTTSETLTRLKSPIMECLRQLAATANSSASCLSA